MAIASDIPDYVKEFIQVKYESSQNITAISKEAIRVFDLDYEVEQVRKWASRFLNQAKVSTTIKRLFFDIETSQMYFRGWRTGEQYVTAEQIVKGNKIICICYKWQYEDEVHRLVWDSKQDDKAILKKFIKVLGEANEIIGHNGDRFDIKQIRTRAIQQRVLMFPKYRTLDTLKKARAYFSFPSNKLDYLGNILEVGRKLDHEGRGLWDKVEAGNKASLIKMVDYCAQDVILLEDVFHVLSPYIDHNTNHAVLNKFDKWRCPECGSNNVSLCHTDTTAMGYIKRHMKCKCKKQYHVSNKTYLSYLKNLSK